jgi:predicted nucleic acid-binding protein
MLVAHLDLGEASAIALALEARVPLVAIDERRGRLVARDVGLMVTGTLGLLLRAKRLGIIDAVAPRLAAMRQKGIWLGEALVRCVNLPGDVPVVQHKN